MGNNEDEEMSDNKGENNAENPSQQDSEKDGKMKEKNEIGLLKKPMAASKKAYKIKPTVPKPFSLETDKRMSRGRLGGSKQSKETRVQLCKSTSLNMKVGTQNLVRSSESRRESTIASINTFTNNGHKKQKENFSIVKAKAQGKEVAIKKPPASAKLEGERTKITKLKMSSSFKASPLPSFYHKKDTPSKPEIKKIPLTQPKSPQLGPSSKSISERRGHKVEAKDKRLSRTISTNAKAL